MIAKVPVNRLFCLSLISIKYPPKYSLTSVICCIYSSNRTRKSHNGAYPSGFTVIRRLRADFTSLSNFHLSILPFHRHPNLSSIQHSPTQTQTVSQSQHWSWTLFWTHSASAQIEMDQSRLEPDDRSICSLTNVILKYKNVKTASQ